MQSFLVKLILSIFNSVFKASKPTAEQGQGPGKEEKDLKNQLKKEGWHE